ncbi:hypothetical protein SAMN04244548_03176 [Paracoccus pantotrophus]|nr:hypothetical protein SAMN04244548_03176 [Paracoccus pantotrophus]
MRRTEEGPATGRDTSSEEGALIGKDGEVRELDEPFFAKAKNERPVFPRDGTEGGAARIMPAPR